MTEKTFTNNVAINIGRMDFQNVLIMACRYALKREEYSTGISFTEFVTPLIPELKMKTLSVMYKDIDNYLEGNTEFNTIRAMWEGFTDSLAIEISSRGCRYNSMYGSWEAID